MSQELIFNQQIHSVVTTEKLVFWETSTGSVCGSGTTAVRGPRAGGSIGGLFTNWAPDSGTEPRWGQTRVKRGMEDEREVGWGGSQSRCLTPQGLGPQGFAALGLEAWQGVSCRPSITQWKLGSRYSGSKAKILASGASV